MKEKGQNLKKLSPIDKSLNNKDYSYTLTKTKKIQQPIKEEHITYINNNEKNKTSLNEINNNQYKDSKINTTRIILKIENNNIKKINLKDTKNGSYSIKSKYILKIIFAFIDEKKYLNKIKYNKYFQSLSVI